jgi:hypothetical protein
MGLKITVLGKPIFEATVRGRRGARSEVEDRLKPNRYVMEVIGEQLVRGFTGRLGKATNVSFKGRRMRPTVKIGSEYPFGIWKGKSPNGAPYVPLKDATINMKKRENRPSGKPASKTPEKPLIDMGDLASGVDYRITYGGRGVQLVFKDSDITEKSLKMERGGSFRSEDIVYKDSGLGRVIKVPARPHRKVQNAVYRKVVEILDKWAEQSGKIDG